MSCAPHREMQLLRAPVSAAKSELVAHVAVWSSFTPGSGVPAAAACHSSFLSRRLPESRQACSAWNQATSARAVRPARRGIQRGAGGYQARILETGASPAPSGGREPFACALARLLRPWLSSERCPSGRRGTPGERVYPQGTEGSNPSLSARFARVALRLFPRPATLPLTSVGRRAVVVRSCARERREPRQVRKEAAVPTVSLCRRVP